MQRVPQQFLRFRHLDDLAQVHDRDAMAIISKNLFVCSI
jgi:hypothetical protein